MKPVVVGQELGFQELANPLLCPMGDAECMAVNPQAHPAARSMGNIKMVTTQKLLYSKDKSFTNLSEQLNLPSKI